jgi:LysR family transcriptional regulator, regulator for bpeEF and oprC
VQAFIEWVRELFDRTNQPGQCAAGTRKALPKPVREEALAHVA